MSWYPQIGKNGLVPPCPILLYKSTFSLNQLDNKFEMDLPTGVIYCYADTRWN